MKGFIEETVHFIEEHVHEMITADIVSRHIGYSKFYLNRLFHIYTGISLIEYSRKRKLNHSLKDLYEGKRILDIALDYGYSSERAYARAFVAEFGKSPSFIRKNPIQILPPLIVYDIKINIRKEWEDMREYISDVSYVTLSDMQVISGIEYGSEPEDAIIGKMTAFEKEHQINVLRRFGFDSPVETNNPEEYRGYEFWLVTEDEVKEIVDHSPYTIKTIPSYKYATLRITDPFADPFKRIGVGWKALVSWLEDNKVLDEIKKNTSVDCLEEVIEIEGTTYMDIFIPIDLGRI